MITAKTSALFAAMAVLGTVAPAAFAQDYSDTFVFADQENEAEIGDISQDIDQSAVSIASTGDYSYGDATSVVDQDADQGFCIQISQSNAAGRDDVESEAENELSAEADAAADAAAAYFSEADADADADAQVDCS
ncbi:MAG TPA: hypothetical protein VKA09_08840 [Nitrososphaeraceae archaeon]|nr:hypothetical protein [Nitrososphaeraceae archaeon]